MSDKTFYDLSIDDHTQGPFYVSDSGTIAAPGGKQIAHNQDGAAYDALIYEAVGKATSIKNDIHTKLENFDEIISDYRILYSNHATAYPNKKNLYCSKAHMKEFVHLKKQDYAHIVVYEKGNNSPIIDYYDHDRIAKSKSMER